MTHLLNGGEGGIRTLDTGLGYTPLAGERLRPLGHLTTTGREYYSKDLSYSKLF